VVVRDVPPDSTVVGVPAHIVYQGGKRVLITDPHEINDPLSDVIIALSDEVKRLKCRLEKLDGELQTARQEPATPFTVEEEERAQYRSEQVARVDSVSMGEGI
jgi:serine O-acetyltransferase